MGRKPEGKAEKLFKKLGKKIDSLLSELNVSTGQAKNEFKDRFEEIKRNKASLENEFKDFKEKNKHKWKEVEDSFDKVGEEIRKAFQTAFSSKKEKEK